MKQTQTLTLHVWEEGAREGETAAPTANTIFHDTNIDTSRVGRASEGEGETAAPTAHKIFHNVSM